MSNIAASGGGTKTAAVASRAFKDHYPMLKILQVRKDHDTKETHKAEFFGREASVDA